MMELIIGIVIGVVVAALLKKRSLFRVEEENIMLKSYIYDNWNRYVVENTPPWER